MATPTTFYKPPPSGEEITKRLEDEIHQQCERTPEPEFVHPHVENSYKWVCEIEYERFAPQEVEKLRTEISSAYYWKVEAQLLQGMLVDCIAGLEKQSPAAIWRKLAMNNRKKLQKQGFSLEQLRDKRLNIEDQDYWEPEAMQLRQMANYRETELLQQSLQETLEAESSNESNPIVNGLNVQKKKPQKMQTNVAKASGRSSSGLISNRILRSSHNSRVTKPSGKPRR